ncbi:MAG: hypothetical protein ACNS61_03475, partial [Candidatus Wenzhouxiangella sp. M2_3B_020]
MATASGSMAADGSKEKRLTAVSDADVAAIKEQSRRLAAARVEAAEWLLEHEDPRKRAAGLLERVSAIGDIEKQLEWSESLLQLDRVRPDGPVGQAAIDGIDRAIQEGEQVAALDTTELLDRFQQAIRTTTDGAALAWLAAACRNAGIETFCIDAGLDAAIVRHDGANLFSRAALLHDAEATPFETLLMEARATRTYEMQLTETWFEALADGVTGVSLSDRDRAVGAFSVSLAYATPAFGDLSRACGSGAVPGSELDIACDRVLDDMADNADGALAQMLPLAIRAERAEALGLDRLAADYEARKQRLHARWTCAVRPTEAVLKHDEDGAVAEHMALIVE